MFDFPNSPSVGQRVTGVGGIVYVWDGVKWTNSVGGVTVQSMGDVGRNLIHNPMFNIAQRGNGAFTTTATYTADRWIQHFVGGSVSTSVNPASDTTRAQVGDEACLLHLFSTFVGGSGTTDVALIQQNIEAVRRLGGKTITVSFWAAGAGLKLGVNVEQNFGTGGSPSAIVTGTGQTVSLTGAFQRYSMTFVIPSTAGKTTGNNNDDCTQFSFWLSAGSSFNTRSGSVGVQSGGIAIWGVQLEIGNVATPLEKPELRYDLSNCQRFYHTNIVSMIGTVSGVAAYGYYLPFPVAMRAIPTVTPGTLTTALNVTGGLIADSFTAFGTRFYCNSTATGVIQFSGTYTASADL